MWWHLGPIRLRPTEQVETGTQLRRTIVWCAEFLWVTDFSQPWWASVWNLGIRSFCTNKRTKSLFTQLFEIVFDFCFDVTNGYVCLSRKGEQWNRSCAVPPKTKHPLTKTKSKRWCKWLWTFAQNRKQTYLISLFVDFSRNQFAGKFVPFVLCNVTSCKSVVTENDRL